MDAKYLATYPLRIIFHLLVLTATNKVPVYACPTTENAAVQPTLSSCSVRELNTVGMHALPP